MKNALFGCALVLTLFAISVAVAETVTLTVTGEIRTRLFYVENLTDLNDNGGGAAVTTYVLDPTTGLIVPVTTVTQDDDYEYVENRVRISVDGELSDGVYTRATLEGTGIWGTTDFVDDGWDANVVEAWVKFDQIKNSPWSFQAGRQYLQFGRGFLISANNSEVEYDAAVVTADFLPWTFSVVWVKSVENAGEDLDGFVGDLNYAPEEARYALGGYVITFADDTGEDFEPLYVGVRGSLDATDAISLFGEAVLMTGDVAQADAEAYALNLGGTWAIETAWSPTVKAEYVYATGDDDPTGDVATFDPLLNYTYYGEAFSPAVSNIHILTAGVDVLPQEKTLLSAAWYYYQQAEEAAMSVGNDILKNPGVSALTTGTDKDLGNEVDLGVTYTYTDNVTTKFIVAYFMPGDAYGSDADDAVEIKGEILVSF